MDHNFWEGKFFRLADLSIPIHTQIQKHLNCYFLDANFDCLVIELDSTGLRGEISHVSPLWMYTPLSRTGKKIGRYTEKVQTKASSMIKTTLNRRGSFKEVPNFLGSFLIFLRAMN